MTYAVLLVLISVYDKKLYLSGFVLGNIYLYVCVCECVCEREIEEVGGDAERYREIQRATKRQRQREGNSGHHNNRKQGSPLTASLYLLQVTRVFSIKVSNCRS